MARLTSNMVEENSPSRIPLDSRINCSFSSPIRPSDSCRNGLVDIQQRQKERHDALFHPLSSPVRGLNLSMSQYLGLNLGLNLNQKLNLNWSSNRGNVINRRNKHDKLREIRERHKNQKMLENREKVYGQQVNADYVRKNDREAEEWFGESHEDDLLQAEEQDRDFQLDEEDRLQQELEEFLRLEQEELEELVANLEI